MKYKCSPILYLAKLARHVQTSTICKKREFHCLKAASSGTLKLIATLKSDNWFVINIWITSQYVHPLLKTYIYIPTIGYCEKVLDWDSTTKKVAQVEPFRRFYISLQENVANRRLVHSPMRAVCCIIVIWWCNLLLVTNLVYP